MNGRTVPILLALSIAGCSQPFTRVDCPPDHTPVYVPTNCTQGYEIFAAAPQASLGATLENLKGKGSINAQIQEAITKLAQDLDQRTVRFRTAYVGLCQSQAAEPCNLQYQQKVLEFRTSLTIQFEETEKKLDTISKDLDTLAHTSGPGATLQQQIVTQLHQESLRVRSEVF